MEDSLFALNIPLVKRSCEVSENNEIAATKAMINLISWIKLKSLNDLVKWLNCYMVEPYLQDAEPF
jgi:hypothetical protein